MAGGDFSVEGRIVVAAVTQGMEQAVGAIKGIEVAAEKGAKSIQSMGERMAAAGKKMGEVGRTMSLAVTAPLVGIGAVAISAASDLAEATSSVETVFGAAAGSILAFSKTSATALGLSKQAALGAATSLGALLTGVGLSTTKAADFSKNLLGASADLASFYNVAGGAEAVLGDLKSGLTGEAEPLKKYGILINEAAVNQELMRTGTDKLTGSQLEAAKVQARYALILNGMGKAQGDFARTAGGLANQTRIAKAQFQDAAATLGTTLLPLALQAVRILTRVATAFQTLSPHVRTAILVMAGVAVVIGPLLTALSGIIAIAPAIATALGVIFSPIGLIAAALIALGIAYRTNFLGFADAVNSVGAAIVRVLQPAVRVIRLFVEGFRKLGGSQSERVHKILNRLPAPLAKLLILFGRVRTAVVVFFRAWQALGALAAFKTIPRSLALIGRTLGNLFGSVGLGRFGSVLTTTFSEAGAVVLDLVNLVDDAVHGRWAEAWHDLGGLAADGASLLLTGLDALPALLLDLVSLIPWDAVGAALLGGMESAFAALGDIGATLWTALSTAIGAIDWAALWDTIVTALTTAADKAIEIGALIIHAAVKLTGTVKDATADFYGWLKTQLKIVEGKVVEVGTILVKGEAELQLGEGKEPPERSFAQKITHGLIVAATFARDAFRTLAVGIATGAGFVAGALVGLAVTAVLGVFNALFVLITDPARAGEISLAFLSTIGDGLARIIPAVGEIMLAQVAAMMRAFQQGFDVTTPDLSGLLGALAGTKDAFISLGVDLINGLISGLSTRFRQFTDDLEVLLASLPGYALGLDWMLYAAGYDLITGFINGIAARWNDLVHFLGDLASHLPDWITGPLGIHSPSTVFMKIGKDTAQGFGIGFAKEWQSLESIARTAAQGFGTAHVRPTHTGPSMLAPSPIARTVHAGGVTIHVNGAGDPDAVAARVYQQLDGAFRRLEMERRR